MKGRASSRVYATRRRERGDAVQYLDGIPLERYSLIALGLSVIYITGNSVQRGEPTRALAFIGGAETELGARAPQVRLRGSARASSCRS
jgi:hypothetical protein